MRPVARAAGRAENQPVRVTSALKKGPRATSAEPAETSRRSETSGASCRTSQEPAVSRDKRAQKRTSHQRRRPRGKCARKEPNIGCTPGTSGGERRNSRTAESGNQGANSGCGSIADEGIRDGLSVAVQGADVRRNLPPADRVPTISPDAGQGERGSRGSLASVRDASLRVTASRSGPVLSGTSWMACVPSPNADRLTTSCCTWKGSPVPVDITGPGRTAPCQSSMAYRWSRLRCSWIINRQSSS